MNSYKYIDNIGKLILLSIAMGMIVAVIVYPYLRIRSAAQWAVYFRYYPVFAMAAIFVPVALIGRVVHRENPEFSKSEKEWRNQSWRARFRVILFFSAGLYISTILGWFLGGAMSSYFLYFS